MPAANVWLVKGRVLHARFWGEPRAADAYAINAEMLRMISADGVAPVHVIVDLIDVVRLPSNMREIMGGMRIEQPQKSGWTIIASRSVMARYIATLTAQFLRQKVRAVSDLDAAYAFLWATDSTLPPEARPAPPAGAGV
jgi:hypothetical protein